MDRIRNLKLRNSLFLYLVIFLTIGIVLSVFTLKICTKVEEAIWLDNIDNIDDFVKFQEEYNAIFQDFLPIPSGTMAKLTIKERVVIELCDFWKRGVGFYLHLEEHWQQYWYFTIRN